MKFYKFLVHGIKKLIGDSRITNLEFQSCTNTHHDVTDLKNHGMVKNTKT